MTSFKRQLRVLEYRIRCLRTAIHARKTLGVDTRFLEQKLSSLQIELADHLRSKPSLVALAR